MSKFIERINYKKRIIDSKIEEYLKVCGALCIEGPKWCGKSSTSSYHCKSEFLIGDPINNFSNRHLAEINPALILQGEKPRDNAYRKANEEQIMAYFELGRFLSNKIKEAEWSSRAIESLAKTIAQFYPELKGFTRSGLYRMIQFYEAYARNEIVSPLASQIRNRAGILGYSIAE